MKFKEEHGEEAVGGAGGGAHLLLEYCRSFAPRLKVISRTNPWNIPFAGGRAMVVQKCLRKGRQWMGADTAAEPSFIRSEAEAGSRSIACMHRSGSGIQYMHSKISDDPCRPFLFFLRRFKHPTCI